MLNRNNNALHGSNNTLLQDNTLFHYKIEHIKMLLNMVAQKANELRVKAFIIFYNVHKYKHYLNVV